MMSQLKVLAQWFLSQELVVPSAARKMSLLKGGVGHTLIGGKNHCVALPNVSRHWRFARSAY
jgi:hypothetical protein